MVIIKTIYLIPLLMAIAIFKMITGGAKGLIEYAEILNYINQCDCENCKAEASKTVKKLFLQATILNLIIFLLIK